MVGERGWYLPYYKGKFEGISSGKARELLHEVGLPPSYFPSENKQWVRIGPKRFIYHYDFYIYVVEMP